MSTITALHHEGRHVFELPPPAGAETLPDPVQRAIRQLCKAYFCANAIPMIERIASEPCRAVFRDWCKRSRDGNKSPVYLPREGQFDEALTATAVLIFSLAYSSVLRATAERQFEITTAWRLEHGHGYASVPEPRAPLLVAPQGRALRQLVPT